MKVVSWNCHYGLNEDKFEKLVYTPDFESADIYAFQEVLENEFIDIADFEKSYGYKYRHWYGDHQEYGDCHIPRGTEGDLGIAVISKRKFKRLDQGLIRFRYVVPYVFYDETNTTEQFILFHVWTKEKPDGYIEPVYKALNYYKNQLPTLPIIMIGDFNFGIVRGTTEGEKFIKEFFSNITNEIPDLKMVDITGKNRQTFYYPRYSDKEYFNDCIYTKGFSGQFSIGNTSDWIKALGAKNDYSDHCPIMAELELNNAEKN